MALSKKIFILAFLITAVLLLAIVLFGNILNNDRKTYVSDQMTIINDLNDLQVYSLMTDVYGDKMACLAFKKKLETWDKSLWDLGLKLESYRVATEEFQKDAFYIEQKTKFNENQVMYLLFLNKVKKDCNLDQQIISFFYRNSVDCKKCDDQSFVLTDIKNELKDKISIFAFDMDLNITNIELLKEYYNISEYPCIIINEKKYCGIQSKDGIMNIICKTDPTLCQ